MSRDPIDHLIDEMCEADSEDLEIDEIDAPAGPPLSAEEIWQRIGLITRN
jgi:hypothetical protein